MDTDTWSGTLVIGGRAQHVHPVERDGPIRGFPLRVGKNRGGGPIARDQRELKRESARPGASHPLVVTRPNVVVPVLWQRGRQWWWRL